MKSQRNSARSRECPVHRGEAFIKKWGAEDDQNNDPDSSARRLESIHDERPVHPLRLVSGHRAVRRIALKPSITRVCRE